MSSAASRVPMRGGEQPSDKVKRWSMILAKPNDKVKRWQYGASKIE